MNMKVFWSDVLGVRQEVVFAKDYRELLSKYNQVVAENEMLQAHVQRLERAENDSST